MTTKQYRTIEQELLHLEEIVPSDKQEAVCVSMGISTRDIAAHKNRTPSNWFMHQLCSEAYRTGDIFMTLFKAVIANKCSRAIEFLLEAEQLQKLYCRHLSITRDNLKTLMREALNVKRLPIEQPKPTLNTKLRSIRINMGLNGRDELVAEIKSKLQGYFVEMRRAKLAPFDEAKPTHFEYAESEDYLGKLLEDVTAHINMTINKWDRRIEMLRHKYMEREYLRSIRMY